jgi:hypothetical protein
MKISIDMIRQFGPQRSYCNAKKAALSNYTFGERGGTRTLDPMIKSHVLYRLSYALTRRAV